MTTGTIPLGRPRNRSSTPNFPARRGSYPVLTGLTDTDGDRLYYVDMEFGGNYFEINFSTGDGLDTRADINQNYGFLVHDEQYTRVFGFTLASIGADSRAADTSDPYRFTRITGDTLAAMDAFRVGIPNDRFFLSYDADGIPAVPGSGISLVFGGAEHATLYLGGEQLTKLYLYNNVIFEA